jgi:GH15 family glucan-1,4-alpha-glucosidase
MALDLALRFDYGSIPARLRAEPRSVRGVVGPDLVVFHSPVDVICENDRIVCEFTVTAGKSLTFVLQYGLSYQAKPPPIDATAAIAATARCWQEWADQFTTPTDWPEAVKRSLITLQALTDAETGGMIAAPTTSLPEVPGGDKNWDYRYTWLHDSTFALSAFLNAGYHDEACAWRDWLLRAAAAIPERLRTMYRVDGSRHIGHHDVPWLPGYEAAGPVRVGNPAADQFQLDIYGEVLDSLYLCEQAGLDDQPSDVAIAMAIAAHLQKVCERPDQGICESRGPAQHFTYSKVMAWVGIDRFLKLA